MTPPKWHLAPRAATLYGGGDVCWLDGLSSSLSDPFLAPPCRPRWAVMSPNIDSNDFRCPRHDVCRQVWKRLFPIVFLREPTLPYQFIHSRLSKGLTTPGLTLTCTQLNHFICPPGHIDIPHVLSVELYWFYRCVWQMYKGLSKIDVCVCVRTPVCLWLLRVCVTVGALVCVVF